MTWYPPNNGQPQGQQPLPVNMPYYAPVVPPRQIIEVKEAPKMVSKKAWGLKEIGLSILCEIALLMLILPIAEGAIKAGNITLAIYASIIGQFGGMYAIWMGFMIYSSFFKGQKSWPRDFGFKFKWYDIFIGLGLGTLTLTIQNVVNFIVRIIDTSQASVTLPSVHFLSSNPAVPYWYSILFGIVLPCICAPFFEELYFRGFIMGGMIRFFKRFTNTPALQWMNKFKYVFSALFSSILFGMLHIQNYQTQGDWLTAILIGTTGFVLAWSAILFKRLGPGMVGHATHNTFITLTS